jgi:phospholipid/cholesterol/gamma-HCH transport system substrate-binding protein
MDQSRSSSGQNRETTTKRKPVIPRQTFTAEFLVGIFAIVGVAAGGWLAVGLGGIALFEGNQYSLTAEFDNVSGLKRGASVEIAGVPVGQVSGITLNDPGALVAMKINNEVPVKEDDIFSIRTKGIIGDRFVKISRGGSDVTLEPGSTVIETESVVDLEDVIGKIVHSMTQGKDDEDESDAEGSTQTEKK